MTPNEETARQVARQEAIHKYLYGHGSVEDQFGQGFDVGWQAGIAHGMEAAAQPSDDVIEEFDKMLTRYANHGCTIEGCGCPGSRMALLLQELKAEFRAAPSAKDDENG